MTDVTRQALIVVGVDGSKESQTALQWAADQAIFMHARLRIVTAWYVHGGYGFPPLLPVSTEETARRALKTMTLEVFARSPEIPVEAELKQGHPRQVLVDSSTDADLLVVGSRGLGGFAGMLLGSVSEYCVSHAKCTVVIVR